jgi:ribosomal protein S18 acetylase RimI-like enzyme
MNDVRTIVERISTLEDDDLDQLCSATDAAIVNGSGFGWLKVPPRRLLQRFWQGVVMVPERELYVARLEGQIVGAGQLLRPPANHESFIHAAQLTGFFIAPWARGHGLARGLLRAVEESARKQGFKQLDLDVRETQKAAIKLFEEWGFERWATKKRYAMVDGQFVAGHYYTKVIA